MSLLPVVLICCFAPAPPPRTDANNGYLGVDFHPRPNELTIESLYVASPALEAGLTAEDVIVALDGMKVQTQADLARLLRKKKPDSLVVVTVRREGQEMVFKVKMGKQFPAHLGVRFGDRFQVHHLTTESPAKRAGVQLGDVVLAIDGKNLAGPEELVAVLKDKKPGDVVTLAIQRNNLEVKIKVTLGKRPGF